MKKKTSRQTETSQNNAHFARRLHIGAEVQPKGGAHFRVWAPACPSVSVVLESAKAAPQILAVQELESESNGYFSGLVRDCPPAAHYRLRLGQGDQLYPDPASRFQPRGPHGPSQVVDPGGFQWTDQRWAGLTLEGQVIYETHVGTFTRKGTWKAAMEQLPELARLGITVIELLPLADFVGRFGWGYDGVDLFAPTRLYGTPDDLRAFVDRAHGLNLAVILDVVYNHFGPDGNYLKAFAADYFTDRYQNDWGEALNFDGPNNGPVREFVLANARYWIDEFHFDGLRLDATQQIFDASKDHILAAIAREARQAAKDRHIFIVGENEPQHARLIRPPAQGGFGLDALWNDDFHHSAMMALTGRSEAYFTDYLGQPQEFISAAKWGFLYQGQRYKWQKNRRGTPTFGLRPAQFVTFIQNHDQVANSLRGHRIHLLTSPGRLRAITALLLLGPGTPMIFQGQEFAASSPFLYFADHKPGLAKLVSEGRQTFLAQFPSYKLEESRRLLPDPGAEATFHASILDLTEREKHSEIYALHCDLLKLRRCDEVLHAQQPAGVDGAVLASSAFVLRFFGQNGHDRILLINLGADLHLDPAPEPLLAPPMEQTWQVLWSSEDPKYGGLGTPPVESEENWRIPGEAAIVMRPEQTLN